MAGPLKEGQMDEFSAKALGVLTHIAGGIPKGLEKHFEQISGDPDLSECFARGLTLTFNHQDPSQTSEKNPPESDVET